MIILDTQYVSQLQRERSRDAAKIEAWLTTIASDVFWITVITPYEQLRSALGLINSAKSADDSTGPFLLFGKLLDHYSDRWGKHILPFDKHAAFVYAGFDARLIRRIGPRDGKIAAIALSHRATLLSANLADLRQVPGLIVEDWLRDDGPRPL